MRPLWDVMEKVKMWKYKWQNESWPKVRRESQKSEEKNCLETENWQFKDSCQNQTCARIVALWVIICNSKQSFVLDTRTGFGLRFWTGRVWKKWGTKKINLMSLITIHFPTQAFFFFYVNPYFIAFILFFYPFSYLRQRLALNANKQTKKNNIQLI